MLPYQAPGESARVRAQLEILLGVDHVDVPRAAVELAYERVRSCTGNDVAAMAGFLAWGLPLRHLRDALCPSGWAVDRSGNFETVRSPSGQIAITSVRGDLNTGTDKMPSTFTEKGPRTQKAVSVNRAQLAFDPKVISPDSNVALLHKELVTWFLLHYYDEDAEEIRLELAVPVEFTTSGSGTGEDERGVATRFESRLPLESIHLDIPMVGERVDEHEAAADVDVPITRRSS